MIDRLTLTNFTVFGKCELDFSSKVNVIVGENGTGKTHLLKAIYALCDWDKALNFEKTYKSADLGRLFTDSLLKTFFPADRKLVELRSRGTKSKSSLKATFDSGRTTEFVFGPNSKLAAFTGKLKAVPKHRSPLFFPAKEVLSFLDGIASKESDRKTIDRLFDDACLDLCYQLLKKTRSFKSNELEQEPRVGTVVPAICNAIGGQFNIEDSRITFIQGTYDERQHERKLTHTEAGDDDAAETAPQLGSSYETVFNRRKGEALRGIMVAEGFRKIGMLQQVLLNRTFVPGQGGPILWDEPEANMNPSLMQNLVRILLDLSRNGQQIILATHDFVLLKWFDLLSDSLLGDNIRFHALYRDSESGNVDVNTTDDYQQLSPNSIDQAFADLTDEEIGRTMGGLGK